MPPTIIITNMSPGELMSSAVDQANKAAAEIIELATLPFEPGETREDRMLLVMRHAFALAEAWQVIDAMAHATTSPPTSPPTASQGCGAEGTN
jgi:hypothetical protein